MKSKLLTMIALLAVVGTVKAQTEKGKNVIGLAASYSSNDTHTLKELTTRSEANFGLNYGRFFWKNLAIGLTASYHTSKSFVPSDYLYTFTPEPTLGKAYTDTRINNFAVGTYLRHYIDISEKLKFYSELTGKVGFGKQSNEYISPNRNYRSGDFTSYQASANAGIVFFPVKRIGIELGVNLASYTHATATYPNSPNEKSVDFSSGLNNFKPMIGINFHF
jgi:hypothetical protein